MTPIRLYLLILLAFYALTFVCILAEEQSMSAPHSITIKVSKRESWYVYPLAVLACHLPRPLQQAIVKSGLFRKLVIKTEVIKHFD